MLLFALWLFLLSSYKPSSATTSSNLFTDQQSLLVLKDHVTSDPHKFLQTNWSATTNPNICNWIGVSCGLKHQRVTALDLSYMDLRGTIPPHIGNLTFLASLDLTSNSFHGAIPEELSGLRRLEKIYLESNNFTGLVPSWFESLPKLRTLSLKNNSLVGIIPVSLGNIGKLEILSLSYNYLNGHVPEELGNLSRLWFLDLKYNQLTGSVFKAIFKLSVLTRVDLTGNRLSGSLPFDVCDRVPKLEGLFISQNQFFGQIPSSLYKCKTLQYLSLSYNGFDGSIPREIGNLTMLKSLYLGDNQYKGSIPMEIGNLINLEILSLKNGSLTGVIPSSIYNISSLTMLDLSFNKLTGNISSSVGNFQSLQEFYLTQNMFTGSIPREIGNLTLLKLLYLHSNNLTGLLPQEIGDLTTLERFGIHDNSLTGIIPFRIYNMSALKVLDLGRNQLSGSLPSRINLPNLEELYLAGNELSGTIPSSISNASKLTILSLTSNSFSGSIPNTIGNLRLLRRLLLGENNLTRESSSMELNFISSLTNCQHLDLLSISLNQLNGVLPKSIGNLSTFLTTFEAFGCKLKGEIPPEIGSLTGLEAILLDNNELTGHIPPTLQRLNNLARLYLEHNKLQGSIPNELCRLNKLGDLYLSDNKLNGSIPVCLGDLKSMQRLYLDSNQLNSTIPSSLWSLTDLIGLNLSSNMISGSISMEIQNLKQITEIGLSWNQLDGYLPSTIGGAQMLIYLSVSHNKLQGSLPRTLGHLINLEFLDLSNNRFSGEIPKSLEALRYLNYFNVSFNSLQGKIPTGGLFSNFTVQSYIENDGLCGIPSMQVCKNEAHQKSWSKYVRILKYIVPSIAVSTLALILIFVVITRRRRNIRSSRQVSLSPSAWERFTYAEIVKATNSFSESNLIGEGGMGSVYRGILPNGVNIAVKVFNLHSDRALESFNVECNIIGSIRHRNLIKIISSCTNLTFRSLILEYMPNGNLESWLYSQNRCLDVLQRINIMIDVASALEYLHHGLPTTIVHSDLKPSNVLLDENMVAHVCDFGISQLLGEEEHMTQTSTLGTIGYMAPEYGTEGIVSAEGDVYSFGILLLETFTGKRPTDEMFSAEQNLISWVNEGLQGSVIEVTDEKLADQGQELTSSELQCISSVFKQAMNCSTYTPKERTNMAEAAGRLGKIRNKFLAEIEQVKNLQFQ
ncbi:hypothetical protein ACET3Z_014620 [Daucus carota]